MVLAIFLSESVSTVILKVSLLLVVKSYISLKLPFLSDFCLSPTIPYPILTVVYDSVFPIIVTLPFFMLLYLLVL